MAGGCCNVCGARFQRLAHLSRHRLQHLGERPFACPSCDRTFTRRDTMQRHFTVHERSRDKHRQESPSRRVKHACRKCSQSKQRCDGKNPCNRCVYKDVSCSYRISQSPERPAPETQRSPPFSQPHQSPIDQCQILDSERTRAIFRIPDPGDTQPVWSRDDFDAQREAVAPSAAQVASGVLPDFASTASDFDAIPLMPVYPGDISMSEFDAPQTQSNIPFEQNVLENRSLELQAFELDPFRAEMVSEDVAYWDVSQYLDTIYQGPGPEFGSADCIDMTETSKIIEPSVSEPDLSPNIASPPAPSFLDARTSPEPMEGQGLKYDDYVRNVFANRRHLHEKEDVGSSSQGRKLEKAHDPPIMGDFPLLLAPGGDDSIWESENLEHVPHLPAHVYEQIATTFQNLNATRGTWIQFASGSFPSLAACNAFMQLYFEEFNPLFPFLHQATFDPATTPWQLVLAIISTGIRFTREPAAAQCGDMMHEFLRRALLATIESEYGSSCEPWLAQAGLLNQIGMAFSSDMRLFQAAQSMRSLLSSICRQVNCFQEIRRPTNMEIKEQSIDDAWKFWLRRESMRRLAYTLWSNLPQLVDSQYLLFFDLPPLIPMKLLRVRLPCYESLWYAPTAAEWLKLYKQNETYLPLSIREELDHLYRSHIRQEGLGDFALLLLTFGVFRTAMEARHALDEGSYLMSYLAQCATQSSQSPQQKVETFSATRKAMEYLQILCPGYDEVPSLSSLKSAIVHHYHAIGILLRIPLDELFCFCGYRVTSTDIIHCESRLKVWLEQRGEEARRVASHAGQLFAHIRRSNLHYHYEGRLMLIACQALWIYTATANATSPSLQGAESAGKGTITSSIRLDQPLVSEADEAWVREGGVIRPFLAGVGSLHGSAGVSRLVQEGSRVMCGSSPWPFNNVQGRCLRIYHQVRSGALPKEIR